MHEEELSRLPVQTTLGLQLVEGEDKTLADLVRVGIDRPQRASSVVAVLMNELGAQTEIPVLLAIDSANALTRRSWVHKNINRMNVSFTLLFCLFACLLVCLFACLLVCLFACLLVCLFACLLVCLFACLLVCLFVEVN